MDQRQKKEGELAYYITLFKLEGHTTWRVNLSQNKEGFALEQKKNWGPKPTKVTDIQILRLDRLTGTFSAVDPNQK